MIHEAVIEIEINQWNTTDADRGIFLGDDFISLGWYGHNEGSSGGFTVAEWNEEKITEMVQRLTKRGYKVKINDKRIVQTNLF